MAKPTVQDDVERLMGSGLVRQDALVRIAEQVWASVPANRKHSYSATEWRDDIYRRCQQALQEAVDKLTEEYEDSRTMLEAKYRNLNATFARQVAEAMQEVSDRMRGIDRS